MLLDKNATNEKIKDALFNWLKQAIEEDAVVIYFAGHGSPESPDAAQNLYLLPYNAKYDNIAVTGFPLKGAADFDKSGSVSVGEITVYVSQQVRRATRNAQNPIVAGRFDPSLVIGK